MIPKFLVRTVLKILLSNAKIALFVIRKTLVAKIVKIENGHGRVVSIAVLLCHGSN